MSSSVISCIMFGLKSSRWKHHLGGFRFLSTDICTGWTNIFLHSPKGDMWPLSDHSWTKRQNLYHIAYSYSLLAEMDTTGLGPNFNKRYKTASSEMNGVVSPYSRQRRETNDELVIKEGKMCIGRFFYESGLDFGAVNSPNFKKMVTLFSRGMNYQIPTRQELKGWIFEGVAKEMRERVDGIRASWADTGCSILLDGWKAANGRELVNVFVECPKGAVYLRSYDITSCVGDMEAMQVFLVKVLAEVGIDNVVQIITVSDSAFFKEAGKQLTDKYRSIYWTVSASYCIELMLEKLRTMDVVKETLEKAKIIAGFIHNNPIALKHLHDLTDGAGLVDSSRIRLIRAFLTLENIMVEKESLKTMFSSSKPSSSILSSTAEGRRVAQLVADKSFWSGASTTVNGAIPLVRILDWMNESDKNHDHIGYIYETIDQAKETIKKCFKNKKLLYAPFWKVIDDVWDQFLYSPLHSAGYYLNPNIFYSSCVFIDAEVETGLLCFICKASEKQLVQDQIILQIEKYKNPRGAMAAGVVAAQKSNISPALWWSRYGGECPELQRLAVRILSQTCDGASKFQLRWRLAERLFLSDGKNSAEKKWLNDMVFLRYNMQLQSFVPGKTNQVDQVDDWIADVVQNDVA